MDVYEASGGKTNERPAKPSQPVDDPIQTCPAKTADLTVLVKYTPYETPIKEATVELVGPTPVKATTDALGVTKFTGLTPGGYTINVTYDKKHPVVDQGLLNVGSKDWAVAASRGPYPSGANKCNLFVFEMANGAGYSVPKRTRFSIKQMKEVWFPPLAGEWADDSTSVGSWSPISESDAEPGDMVAEAVAYSNASGHVGIISYPEPTGMSRQLMPDERAAETIYLQRRVISAGSDEILNNDYFWSSRRHNVPHYKRYSK